MNFTLIDDDCTVADLFVWISFQKLHDWFFSSSHACQFQSLLNPYSQNLEFVYERLCCGRSIFFFVMMKMKIFVVEFKKQTWIFILFFFFVTMTNTPSNTNTNGFFGQICFCASRQIKCLFHGHFCLFCLISMYVMTLSLWLHILVERYAACARNINMRRTENDRFTFAGNLM